MNTEIVKLTKENFEKEIETAANIINKGGLVIFPTETVYGLGADAMDAASSSKIYAAKGRPSDNPLIVHISNIGMLTKVAANVSDTAKKIMSKFWPGPLTLILERGPLVPHTTTGGLDTVAVRFPVHKAAAALIDKADTPIAAPSANISGRPSITDEETLVREMSSRVDMILLDDSSPIGLESTVLDMTSETPVILRPGFIEQKQLESFLGQRVAFDVNITDSSVHPKSPGMKYRHYSPICDMSVVTGSNEQIAEKISHFMNDDKSSGIKSAVMKRYDYPFENFDGIYLGDDNQQIAKNLFKSFRQLDELGYKKAYFPYLSDGPLAFSIMDRVKKAAGSKIV